MNFFEEYEVRRRSAGRTVSRVPRPVLRSLVRALQARVSGDGKALAETLWKLERAEAKELAIRVLEVQTEEYVPELVQSWAKPRLPIELIEQLAGRGLAGWRQAEWGDFLHRTLGWLDGKHAALAFYALAAAVEDGAYSDLPHAFKSVHGRTAVVRGREKRALAKLIYALAEKAPAETSHYLLAELAEGGSAARRMIRRILPDLPSEVRKALGGPGGIMRRISGQAGRAQFKNRTE